MRTSDFDFELPDELIASRPLANRDASRMLVVGLSCDQPSSPPLEGSAKPGVVRDSVNYRTLPFNPLLKDKAKELRKAGSLPEALLWREIKNKKLNSLDFDRQKIIGNYIVDFFCASNFLVVEIDDKSTHDNKWKYDEDRDNYLKSLNLTVIHISAVDVLKSPSAVCDYLSNHPAAARHPSNGGELASYRFEDRHVRDFLDYIKPGDVVVFNNSKVIPARFDATDESGNTYEITLHTQKDNYWYGLCKKFNKLNIGDLLTLDDNETQIKIIDKDDESGLLIEFILHSTQSTPHSIFSILEKIGKMPLPPYMKRADEIADRDRYQTVYAGPLGSMAAPTAGLHFTDDLLSQIQARGAKIVNVTLHVGAGTWMPVKSEDLSTHKMHSEWGCITHAQSEVINSAKRVIAVGTTSLRLLESASSPLSEGGIGSPRVQPFCASTDIFITPGYKFRVVDVLLTNFHLPKSTLFMLVSAFAGCHEMRAAYAHAINEKYRFFSYGDCCLLFKKEV